MDAIDQAGLNSNLNFQLNVFSSDEYFQDFTILSKHIFKPVLVITGEYDHAGGPNHHNKYRFPKAKIQTIYGGHQPYIENQTAFKDAILHFITEWVSEQ